MQAFGGPWGKTNYSNLPQNEQLTQEIKDFVKWIEPTPDEAQIRYFTIMKYTKYIEYLFNSSNVETFNKKGYKNKKYSVTVVGQGSSFTKCYIPSSDIDLIVLGLSDDVNISDCLYKIVNQLWHSRLINNAIVLKHAKVPIAKIVDRQFDMHIDISVGQINGALNIPRVLNYFSIYPLLRSILLFMKVFTFINDIHDPAKGGFGSNHMMLIIIFVIQQNPDIKTEGDLLIAVFEFLASKMNLFLTGISTNSGGHFFSKFQIEFEERWPHSIICQDPQYPENFYGIRSKQSLTLVENCRKALNIIRLFSTQQNKQTSPKSNTPNFFSKKAALSNDDSDNTPEVQSDGDSDVDLNSNSDDTSNSDSVQILNTDSIDTDDSDVIEINGPTILSRILDGISVITERRKEFKEFAALWRLPAREYNAKMATRDQLLRSKSTPNLKKEKDKISKKNEERKLRNLEFLNSRNMKNNKKFNQKNSDNKNRANQDNKNHQQPHSNQKNRRQNDKHSDKRKTDRNQDNNNRSNKNHNEKNNEYKYPRDFGRNSRDKKKPYKR
ncbi:hypothetical protein M9Y10_017423 [Tritrichomonas musculus]|uniref:Poly(A) RNA polymerase mitochondrial-like central palm domain-containing protein n=1 Tax=Tritrichomonas musculus TaxID=1915356 RepID=A0ABR2HV83_9EUKA